LATTALLVRLHIPVTARGWHSLASMFFCLIFMVPLSLTSLKLLLEKFDIFPGYYPDYRVRADRAEKLPAGFDGATLDQVIAIDRNLLAGLSVTDVNQPVAPGMPIAVHGDLTALFMRSVANTVCLDPFDGSVRGHHRGENIAKRLRLFEATRTLHFGSFGGLATRILWFVFGTAMSVLAAPGKMIYAERLAMTSQNTG
jgi:uncharacterized iron-regulated membrane protein